MGHPEADVPRVGFLSLCLHTSSRYLTHGGSDFTCCYGNQHFGAASVLYGSSSGTSGARCVMVLAGSGRAQSSSRAHAHGAGVCQGTSRLIGSARSFLVLCRESDLLRPRYATCPPGPAELIRPAGPERVTWTSGVPEPRSGARTVMFEHHSAADPGPEVRLGTCAPTRVSTDHRPPPPPPPVTSPDSKV